MAACVASFWRASTQKLNLEEIVSWWTAVPAILVCIALVVAPGAILAFALGFRRITLLGLAPVLSLSVVGVAAVGAPFVGAPWNIWAVLVLCVVASAAAWFVTGFRAKAANRESMHRDSWLAFAAAVIGVGSGALLVARRIMQLVGAAQRRPAHSGLGQRIDAHPGRDGRRQGARCRVSGGLA